MSEPDSSTLHLSNETLFTSSSRSVALHQLAGFLEQFPEAAPLGEGGWSEVISARRQGRRVAVKILNARQSREADRARFAQEFALLKRLQHPALVEAVEWGEWNGRLFYSMELVDGTPFLAYLTRHPDQLKPLFGQLLETLHYIHSQDVLHRDLKPGNLMVDRAGRLRLLDFGIARDLTSTRRHTSTGTVVGTPGYMAPEQLQKQPVDGRADLFGVGVLLYEALLGRQPFSAPELHLTIERVLDEDPELDEIPAPLREVVRRLLHKIPGGRPPDALEALRLLNQA